MKFQKTDTLDNIIIQFHTMLSINSYLLLNAIAPSYSLGFGYSNEYQCVDYDGALPIAMSIYPKLAQKGENQDDKIEEIEFDVNLTIAKQLARDTTFKHEKNHLVGARR